MTVLAALCLLFPTVPAESLSLCPTLPDDSCADLAVTISDSPDPAAAGADLVYAVAISNDGPWTTSPTVATMLAPGLQLQSFSEPVLSAAGLYGCTAGNTSLDPVVQRLLASIARPGQAGTAVACKLGPLEPGEDHTMTIVARPSPELEGQTLNTVAAVEGDRSDLNLANNTDSASTTVRTPAIYIDDVVVTEDTDAATFTVSRSTASVINLLPVTVDFSTTRDTAGPEEDYASTKETLTFFPGDISLTVRVPLLNDSLHEDSETFFANLSAPTNAAIADHQATATISDDDPQPSLSIADVSVTEGRSGTTRATFTVSLSAPSGLASAVDFATADDSAVAPRDYTATSGTLTFPPGQQVGVITVLVNGDRARERNEIFGLNLSAAINATIADERGVGTIINDD